MSVPLFLLAIALLGAAYGDEIPTEEHVLILSKSNFDHVVSTTDYILVEFYAPWCGHCKSLAPEYEAAATLLDLEKSHIKLAKVDATREQELAEQHKVKGYPTLIFFKNGTPMDYTGGRQAEDIIVWLKKKVGPPAIEVTSLQHTKDLREDYPIIVFGYFTDISSEKAQVFFSVASVIDDKAFALVTDENLIKELGVEPEDIVMFKDIEEPRVKFENLPVDEDSFKTWVFVQSMPTIVEFSHDTAAKIFGGQIKYHLLIFLSKKEKQFDLLNELRPVANKYRQKIMSVVVNSDEDDHQRILEFFGMKKEEVPSARLIALEHDMAKYKPVTKELNAENMEAFITSFLDGTLKKHLLSESIPDDWALKPVKRLVARTFDDVVFDTTRKVLVEFYAPWCGHCKQLEPIYNELGEHFDSDPEVAITKIDATANELEHTKITSFPTIKLYTKNNQVRDYNGERSLAALIKFVESQNDDDEFDEDADAAADATAADAAAEAAEAAADADAAHPTSATIDAGATTGAAVDPAPVLTEEEDESDEAAPRDEL